MKFRFWGVRGSIASTGPQTMRYGGNTTCIEVRTDDNTLIVLDGGTGIFQLAQTLLREMPVQANIFLTHTHWDHIQGLPFFTPLFVSGNKVRIHGAYDVVTGSGIDQVMRVQLQYSYFPVREAEMKATIEYETLTIGTPVKVGDATVTGILLNHPVVNLGYRIDCNGKSLFFTGDHEPYSNIYAPEDAEYAGYQAIIDEKQQSIEQSLRGVDVLIADSAYSKAEYPKRQGWGHGTFDSSIALGRKIGAKRVFCTHHEPTRSDDDLEALLAESLSRANLPPDGPSVELAREGLEIVI
jgi:phosphoribosyl 1,2-cyclic phosphodiesterase